MIKIENLETFGWEAAMRGMRNPLNSWRLNDTGLDTDGDILVGPNDLRLMKSLTRAGVSHRKVLRMLHIQMDITAPLYWWKDYDTYKVSTVANSCSTMHRIHAEKFTMDNFAHDKLDKQGLNLLSITIDSLNVYRQMFLDSNKTDKDIWYNMIQLLPSSYLQKRTVDINYETALSIIHDRRYHKLDEFRELTKFLLMELPYMDDIFTASLESSSH